MHTGRVERNMIKGKLSLLPLVLLVLGIYTTTSTGSLTAQTTTSPRPTGPSEDVTVLESILQTSDNPSFDQIDEVLQSVPRGLLAAQRLRRYNDKIHLLLNASRLAERKGEIVQAKVYWKSAIDILSDKKADAESARIYTRYAEFLRYNGEPLEAIQQLQNAAGLFRISRSPGVDIKTNEEISHIYAEIGSEAEALDYAEIAISSAIAIDDLVFVGDTHRARGITQMILAGSHQRDLGHSVLNTIQLIHSREPEQNDVSTHNNSALESLETAIGYFKQAGDERNTADCLRLKGDVMLHSYKLEDAKKYFQEAYQLFSSAGKDPRFVNLQLSMAARETMAQKIDSAIRTINAAVSSNEIESDTPWLLLLKAEIALKDFNDPEAKSTLEQGLEIATRDQDLDQLIALNQLLSLVEINLGNYREGFMALDAATQYQVQQVNAEKEQILLGHDQELKSLEEKISEQVTQRTQQLENQLFTYQAYAKNGWIMGLTFVVCFIGLMTLRLRNQKDTERELFETKTKLLEAEEIISHARDDRNSVFKNLAQELRTPMNGIVGAIPLLHDTTLTSLQENCVNIIDVSSRSITTLISDISDLSQLESGKLKLANHPLNLTQVVETVVQLFEADADHADVEIVCEVPSDPTSILHGDSNRIQQILITLISRALQSTYEGFVFIHIEPLIPNNDRNLGIRLTIEDSGQKPDPDALKDFFALNPVISGANSLLRPSSMMGLSITKKLVDAMKGQIEVSDSKHGGLKIQITLPFSLQPDEEKWETPEPYERFPRKRALVIDASQPSCNVLTKHLRAWALNFETVEDVNSASRLLESTHGFDIIFLGNVTATPDLSVLEKIAAIRSHGHAENTPIILLSALSNLNSSLELKRQKYIHQVSKPFSVQQLHAALWQALHYKTPVSKSYAKLTPDISSESSPEVDLGLTKSGFQFIPYILPMRRDIFVDPDLRILLAEDNIVNQKVTALMLKKMGYEIKIVPNGRKAVEIVGEEVFDVVLMDKIMPVMDGLEASRAIRKLEHVHQPIIIALTASATMEDEIACRKATMDNFLAKPVQLEKMKAALGFATQILLERKKQKLREQIETIETSPVEPSA